MLYPVVICFALLALAGRPELVRASELTGFISTDPRKLGQITGPAENSASPPGVSAVDPISASAAAVQLTGQNAKASSASSSGEAFSRSKVLGAKQYPDFSLLRGKNRKIFLTCGRFRKYIPNLIELRKYGGQAIFNVEDSVLGQYLPRGHLDGELIRMKDNAKVYVINNGEKRQIASLEELRKKYFGLEIFNLERREMENY